MFASTIVKNYTIVKTREQFDAARKHILSHDFLAFDTETTGLNVRKEKVIGFSFCGKEGEAFYIPHLVYDTDSKTLNEVWSRTNCLELLNLLLKKRLLTWNGSFDARIVKNYFYLNLTDNIEADGMLLQHTLCEDGPFALKECAIQYQQFLGLDVERAANEEQIALKANVLQNGGTVTKGNFEMYKADLELLGTYAAADADLTFRLCEYLNSRLFEEGLDSLFYETEVMPLYRTVTIPMEDNGVCIDVALLDKSYAEIKVAIEEHHKEVIDALQKEPAFEEWYLNRIAEEYPPSPRGKFAAGVNHVFNLGLEKVLKKAVEALPESDYKHFLLTGVVEETKLENYLAGFERGLSKKDAEKVQRYLYAKDNQWPINLNSKAQLSSLVFDYLGVKSTSQTKGGAPQFNDDFIESIENTYKWAKVLSDYNKLVKIRSSYFERLYEMLEDGKVYFGFKQHGTISGRYSSDAQQFPRPKEEGELSPTVLKFNNVIRAILISGPGRVFIDDDYESLEPHVFSHVSGDKKIQEIFHKGWDFYSTIAIRTEGIENASADKKADNYLGKVNKPKRQNAKAYCFTKDTLVTTESGQVTINNVKVGDGVLTREGFKKVERTFSKKSPVILVHTNRGTLECTADHQIWVTGKGWIEAADLSKGDEVLHIPQISPKEEPVQLDIMSNMSFSKGGVRPLGKLHLDPEWSYFIGAMLGDGVISIKQTPNSYGHGLKGYVGICGDPADFVVEKVSSFMADLGYPPRLHSKKGNCETMVNTNSELCKVVYDTLGLGDMTAQKKCKNLKVPDYMFNAPVDCKIAFLAGILDTDGYVKKIQNTSVACFTSKDHRFTTGVAVLLSSIGIETTYEPQYNKTYDRYYYTLRIPVSSCVKLKELGIHNYMVVPRKRDMFASVVVKQNKPSKPAHVVLIEDLKQTKEVFDIRVKDCHEFLANGIVVHNCLGVPYGMTGYALAKALGISTEEGERLVEAYLTAFPDLANWMAQSRDFVKAFGYIKTQAGRVRHLPRVKELYALHGDKLLDFRYRKSLEKRLGAEVVLNMYRDYKNGLNNALNFQIQGLSASIINLAMIEMSKQFKEQGLDAYVALTVHDQVIVDSEYGKKEQAAKIVQTTMENSVKLDVALKAKPQFAHNMRDGH